MKWMNDFSDIVWSSCEKEVIALMECVSVRACVRVQKNVSGSEKATIKRHRVLLLAVFP